MYHCVNIYVRILSDLIHTYSLYILQPTEAYYVLYCIRIVYTYLYLFCTVNTYDCMSEFERYLFDRCTVDTRYKIQPGRFIRTVLSNFYV